MTTNGKEFTEQDMKIIKTSYKGVNRIYKPIAVLFYTDVLNGENDPYGYRKAIFDRRTSTLHLYKSFDEIMEIWNNYTITKPQAV